jgi:hypothetical protein
MSSAQLAVMKSQDFRSKLIRIWIDDVVVSHPLAVEIHYHDGRDAPWLSIGLCESCENCPSWLHLKESDAGISKAFSDGSVIPEEKSWEEIPSDTDAVLRVMLDFVEAFEGRYAK